MRDFLDLIHGDSGYYVEVRAIMDGKVRQWWTTDREEAQTLAFKLNNDGWDVYFGVLPRIRTHGTADDVVHMQDVVWADLDDKAYNGDKGACLMALIDYELPPAVIVDSGHGYHAYWLLREKIGNEKAVLIMRGLARILKGDHVYDPARILRLPGTTNWKDPDHPMPVRVLRMDGLRRQRVGDFVGPLTVGESERARAEEPGPKRVYVPPANRQDLPDWLDGLIRDGAPQGQRSEQAFKVMCQLLKRGYSDEEIRAAFDQGGIGDKMREMRSGGERWFRRSLSRAKTRLR